MTAGLLMESVQAQQQHVDAAVERLMSLAQGLDAVVREAVRMAFAEEFQALGVASQRAAEALHAVRRIASLRMAAWSIVLAAGCSAVPVIVTLTVLPSRTELAGMRAQRDELASAVARLERAGGKVDLRRCGAANRLCVRIERDAPAFGAQSDYLIVKGY